MTDSPVSLNEVRAEKEGDCRMWSVAECLRAVLRDIEEGKINPDAVYVAMRETGDDGGLIFPCRVAGLNTLELWGMISAHLHERIIVP